MKIKAEITQLLDGSKNTKAYADVILDDEFVIHGVGAVIKDGKRFISMPSKVWKNKNGEEKRRDVCHPIVSAFRIAIQEAVFTAYDKRSQKSIIEIRRKNVCLRKLNLFAETQFQG